MYQWSSLKPILPKVPPKSITPWSFLKPIPPRPYKVYQTDWSRMWDWFGSILVCTCIEANLPVSLDFFLLRLHPIEQRVSRPAAPTITWYFWDQIGSFLVCPPGHRFCWIERSGFDWLIVLYPHCCWSSWSIFRLLMGTLNFTSFLVGYSQTHPVAAPNPSILDR